MCTPTPIVLKSVPDQPPTNLFLYAGDGPWFTSSTDGDMPPRVADKGMASARQVPISTLPALFKQAATKKGKTDMLLVERPVPPLDGKVAPPAFLREKWTSWSVAEYHADVKRMAKAYISLGFQQFDSVAVWGFNAPEWCIGAWGGMYIGGKAAGLYPTDTAAIAAYKVMHSGASIVVVETRSQLDKLVGGLNELGTLSRLKGIIAYAFEPATGEKVSITGCGDVPVLSWKSALDLGSPPSGDATLEKMADAVKPGHAATIIYTSGTTGDPKAVMLSHDNVIYQAMVIGMVVGKSVGLFQSAAEERQCSYLPMSHVAGMILDVCAPVIHDALFPSSTAIFFARPYDLKAGTIKDRLSIAEPTIFLGVPLVWEKMADKIRQIAARNTGCTKRMGDWSKGKALQLANNISLGGSGAVPVGHCVAAKLLSKVKEGVGLHCCKFAVAGAAPIRTDTLEYFGSLGIQINELYGMSESAGVSTLGTDQAHQWGSCGAEIPGVEVKCFKVDPTDMNVKKECPRAPTQESLADEYQGELCFRGRTLMMGYLACKDMGAEHIAEIEKKNAETIDKEGWLHSGDKGIKTAQGMVKITGRYKELIIGEGGENIAPVPIEDSIKSMVDGIAECMMIGDQRKYNVAFVTLKAIGANGDTPGTDNLESAGKLVNPDVTTITQAMKDEKWIKTITDAITKTNNNAKICPNNVFKIQKFCILPQNFSEERGELTPTKKLKRKVVEKSFDKMVGHMYETDGVYIEYKAF